MHSPLLAQAALPAPTVVCGLLLRPFSLGHQLYLIREQVSLESHAPTLHAPRSDDLCTAVLICAHTWDECRALSADWLISLKLWIWKKRIQRLSRKETKLTQSRKGAEPHRPDGMVPLPSAPLRLCGSALKNVDTYLQTELTKFRAYLADGCLEFPLSETLRPDRGSAPRQPGAPFILRLHAWLMTYMRLTESEAWDYPIGLAKMRWAAHWEQEGGLDIYNAHDAEFDRFVQEQEKKRETAKRRDSETAKSPTHPLADSPAQSPPNPS